MGASVRIEDEAFADTRYDELASYAGLADADHARGKMAVLWRQCTLEQRHVVSEFVVRRVLGDNGVQAICDARLGDKVASGIRIRGTKGRIEWLERLRKNGKYGKLGGRPKKTQTGSKINPEGFDLKTPPAPAPAPAPSQENLLPVGERENTSSRKKGRARSAAVPSLAAPFRLAFETLYAEANDGARPMWDAKKNALAAQLVGSLGSEGAIRRAEIMFRHPRAWPPPPYDIVTLHRHVDLFVTNGKSGGNGNGSKNGALNLDALNEAAERERIAAAKKGRA